MSDTPPDIAEEALDVDASLPEALVLLVDDNQQNLHISLLEAIYMEISYQRRKHYQCDEYVRLKYQNMIQYLGVPT